MAVCHRRVCHEFYLRCLEGLGKFFLQSWLIVCIKYWMIFFGCFKRQLLKLDHIFVSNWMILYNIYHVNVIG